MESTGVWPQKLQGWPPFTKAIRGQRETTKFPASQSTPLKRLNASIGHRKLIGHQAHYAQSIVVPRGVLALHGSVVTAGTKRSACPAVPG